jgi:hypothetical protein
MSEEQELAIFLTWLDTLEQALATNSTIFLDGRHDPWHVMNLHASLDENGIPKPDGEQMVGSLKVPSEPEGE